MADRKSVVLVTVDCLRADHCGFMGYGRRTTPFLDRLAGESLVFPAAFVAGVPTYYSVPAILASRFPLEFGREVIGLAVGEQNIASALRESGYATAFFGAANPYLSPRFGYDFGFDTFVDFLNHSLTSISDDVPALPSEINWAGRLNRTLSKMSHRIAPLGAVYDELYFQYCQRCAASGPASLDSLRCFPAADVIVDQAVTWLASVGERPFFLWLHLMDPHSPYYPTAEGQELLGEKPVSAVRARYLNGCWNRSPGPRRLRRHREGIVTLYDSGVCWVDAQIGRLIEVMRRAQLWESCIFALTADHGEEFLEHDGRYHAPSSLAEELIHVPLVLSVPGVERKEVSKAPFSLLDLAPTLFDAADLTVPGEFQGQSRWAEIREGRTWSGPAIAECIAGCTNPFQPELRSGPRILGVREARYKLVLNFENSTEHLFDLEADPAERVQMPNHVAKAERRLLLEAASEHLRKPRQRGSEAYLRTRLRDLELNLANAAYAASANPAGPAKWETRKAE
jgi:arylsulfatase A-like enzyme